MTKSSMTSKIQQDERLASPRPLVRNVSTRDWKHNIQTEILALHLPLPNFPGRRWCCWRDWLSAATDIFSTPESKLREVPRY